MPARFRPPDASSSGLAAWRQADEERRSAAGHASPPEILMLLALDPDPSVRREVAANPAAPPHADRLLSDDPDTSTRVALAGKLGPRAAEAMGGATRRDRLWQAALERLAADVEAEVRATLADALADLPDAPRLLVLRLARDAALEVCEPLIRLSRALREEDLLALIEEPPGPFTRRAVAGRLSLGEAPCRALLRCGEAEWRSLLANQTARIPPDAYAALLQHARQFPWLPAALATRRGFPRTLLAPLLPLLAHEARARLLDHPDLPPALREALSEAAESPKPALSWNGDPVTEASRKRNTEDPASR